MGTRSVRHVAISGLLASALVAGTWSVAGAEGPGPTAYRELPLLGNRLGVWMVAELHLMFAA
ncbi:MAG: hypothetical protein HY689_07200, partial [Chloroflexi bacterium]|nr:hypothetical protein [Chloroflexota bacterium]